jgi:hypothetical protein
MSRATVRCTRAAAAAAAPAGRTMCRRGPFRAVLALAGPAAGRGWARLAQDVGQSAGGEAGRVAGHLFSMVKC